MFPDIVCVSVWEMAADVGSTKSHILISYFNVLLVSFTMSVNERTYIMIKVGCIAQNIKVLTLDFIA